MIEADSIEEHRRRLKEDHHLYCRHFQSLDCELEEFATEHDLELVRNQNRVPGRLLRSKGNPQWLIGISLDGRWHEMEYSDDLPHSVGVAACFWPERGVRFYRNEQLEPGILFSVVRARLPELLQDCWQRVRSWPVPDFVPGSRDLELEGWRRTGKIDRLAYRVPTGANQWL